VYLNNCIPIITKKRFVTKNSIGDFTSPQARTDEKLAGLTNGPVKNIEGNSTRNINARNKER
jgi:hypothetical protein